MKSITSIMLVAAGQVFAIGAHAATEPPVARTFYVGDARVMDLGAGKGLTIEPVALERTVAGDEISETACTVAAGTAARSSTVYMERRGKTLTVTNRIDGTGAVRGSGVIRMPDGGPGPGFIHLSMQFALPDQMLRIEDNNYLVGNSLIARKSLFLGDGSPIQLWEAELTAVDRAAYSAKRQSLACPSGSTDG